MRVGKNNSKF